MSLCLSLCPLSSVFGRSPPGMVEKWELRQAVWEEVETPLPLSRISQSGLAASQTGLPKSKSGHPNSQSRFPNSFPLLGVSAVRSWPRGAAPAAGRGGFWGGMDVVPAGGSVWLRRPLPGIIPWLLPRRGLGSHPRPVQSCCQAEGMILSRICPGEPGAGGDVSFSVRLIPAGG